MSFCGLTKRIFPKICILCVRVKINKRSFEPFCVWILFQNASSHSVSDFFTSPRTSRKRAPFNLSGLLWRLISLPRQGSRHKHGARVNVCGMHSGMYVGVVYNSINTFLKKLCIYVYLYYVSLYFLRALLVWMSLAVLACEGLHVCIVCTWRAAVNAQVFVWKFLCAIHKFSFILCLPKDKMLETIPVYTTPETK